MLYTFYLSFLQVQMMDLLLLIIEKLIQVMELERHKKINKEYKIMADLVVNHGSSKSKWFENFLKQSGKGKDFFFSVTNLFDTSKVVRPEVMNC